jgi:hypothetical protein
VAFLPSRAGDLAKTDWTIRKEPAYHSKPQYFLLVFGVEARKHVWVVLDGDDFYVDRNGNGDLTETGGQGKIPGEVEMEGEGNTKVTLLINPRDSEGVLFCQAYVRERYMQCASVKPADRPEDAPVYHFQGPLCVDLVGPDKLVRGHPNGLEVVVGTPSWSADRIAHWVTVWQSESIPFSIRPRMEIEFPGKKPGESPIRFEVALQRGQASFLATVRVPDEAGPENAMVHLSFPDWEGFDVAPSVREVPLREPGPVEASRAKQMEYRPRLLDDGKHVLDLATVDRNIPPEPAYQSKPQYCLLLLGREAETRIWLVLDGDTLYVDRNGRGDWVKADKQDKGWTALFKVPEIRELDGTVHTDLEVYAQASRIHLGRYHFGHISLNVRGRYKEYTSIGGWSDRNLSGESPQQSPLRHFHGPLRMESGNQCPLTLGNQTEDLRVRISTRYPSGEWVFIDNRLGIPTDIHPVAEFEFPNREPGRPPVKLKVFLTVSVHGSRVTAVQVRRRYRNMEPDLAPIGPQQPLTAVLRSGTRSGVQVVRLGREDRS